MSAIDSLGWAGELLLALFGPFLLPLAIALLLLAFWGFYLWHDRRWSR